MAFGFGNLNFRVSWRVGLRVSGFWSRPRLWCLDFGAWLKVFWFRHRLRKTEQQNRETTKKQRSKSSTKDPQTTLVVARSKKRKTTWNIRTRESRRQKAFKGPQEKKNNNPKTQNPKAETLNRCTRKT